MPVLFLSLKQSLFLNYMVKFTEKDHNKENKQVNFLRADLFSCVNILYVFIDWNRSRVTCLLKCSRASSARVFNLHVCVHHECSSCLFTSGRRLTSAVTSFASVCRLPTEKLVSKTNEDCMILFMLTRS